jgi:hypothetical protein
MYLVIKNNNIIIDSCTQQTTTQCSIVMTGWWGKGWMPGDSGAYSNTERVNVDLTFYSQQGSLFQTDCSSNLSLSSHHKERFDLI